MQTSTRFDDILNPPLSECEWIRRPRERQAIGLRSCAVRGKAGPRLWVASLTGASPETDDWLQALMHLLLEAHGETRKQDDHMGKVSRAGGAEFTKMPARLETDVSLVKTALERYSKEGFDIGMKDEEVAVLRWHGARAMLSSIMHHLNLRHTRLRECQTLVFGKPGEVSGVLKAGRGSGATGGRSGGPWQRPGRPTARARKPWRQALAWLRRGMSCPRTSWIKPCPLTETSVRRS